MMDRAKVEKSPGSPALYTSLVLWVESDNCNELTVVRADSCVTSSHFHQGQA